MTTPSPSSPSSSDHLRLSDTALREGRHALAVYHLQHAIAASGLCGLADLVARLATAEGRVTAAEGRVAALEERVERLARLADDVPVAEVVEDSDPPSANMPSAGDHPVPPFCVVWTDGTGKRDSISEIDSLDRAVKIAADAFRRHGDAHVMSGKVADRSIAYNVCTAIRDGRVSWYPWCAAWCEAELERVKVAEACAAQRAAVLAGYDGPPCLVCGERKTVSAGGVTACEGCGYDSRLAKSTLTMSGGVVTTGTLTVAPADSTRLVAVPESWSWEVHAAGAIEKYPTKQSAIDAAFQWRVKAGPSLRVEVWHGNTREAAVSSIGEMIWERREAVS